MLHLPRTGSGIVWNQNQPDQAPDARRKGMHGQSAGDAMRCCGEKGWFDVFRKVRSNVREAGGTAGRLSRLGRTGLAG